MTAIIKRASNDLDTIYSSFKEEFGDYFDTDNLGSNQENDAVQKKSQIFKDLLATIDVYSVGEVNFDNNIYTVSIPYVHYDAFFNLLSKLNAILFSFREFDTFRANIEARILPNNRSDRPYLIYDDYSDNNKDFLHYTDFYKAPPKGYNDRKALCQIKITIGNKEIADLLKP